MGLGRERLEAISEQRTIGILTILEGMPSVNKKCMVKVRCKCGKTFNTMWANVKAKKTRSCGCRRLMDYGLPKIERKSYLKKLDTECQYCGEHYQIDTAYLNNLEKLGTKYRCKRCAAIASNMIRKPALNIDKKYGFLSILRDSHFSKGHGGRFVVVSCVCSKTLTVRLQSLKRGDVRSCGCKSGELRNKVSLISDIYGKLNVIGEVERKNPERRRFSCKCHCGQICEVNMHELRSGDTKSCGCIKESKPEEEVYKYILSLMDGVEVIRHDRKILEGRELDIFIPALNLAVEFNGLRFHSEKFKEKSYHLDKTKKCSDKGIFLLHVWDDEWSFRTTQVKAKIKSLLGRVDAKIFARKTEIGIPSKTDKKLFYDNNHIQGSCGSSIDIGLYGGGLLVACMSFVKKKDKVWELVRYATSLGVVGGFSKLLSHFKKTNDWEKIISFADLAWSKGELYEKTGWVKDKVMKPDYTYVRNRHRHHKFGFRHKALKKKLKTYNPDLSEHQNMLNNGIYRIYDYGRIRYILENKDVSS